VKNAVILLLENTAGQGTEIGYTFDQIKKIIDGVPDHERVGSASTQLILLGGIRSF